MPETDHVEKELVDWHGNTTRLVWKSRCNIAEYNNCCPLPLPFRNKISSNTFSISGQYYVIWFTSFSWHSEVFWLNSSSTDSTRVKSMRNFRWDRLFYFNPKSCRKLLCISQGSLLLFNPTLLAAILRQSAASLFSISEIKANLTSETRQ